MFTKHLLIVHNKPILVFAMLVCVCVQKMLFFIKSLMLYLTCFQSFGVILQKSYRNYHQKCFANISIFMYVLEEQYHCLNLLIRNQKVI